MFFASCQELPRQKKYTERVTLGRLVSEDQFAFRGQSSLSMAPDFELRERRQYSLLVSLNAGKGERGPVIHKLTLLNLKYQ